MKNQSKNQNTPHQHLKNSWLFILGRESLLSAAEIIAVFSSRKINYEIEKIAEEKMVVRTNEDIIAPELMPKLGGCIKICKKLDITRDGIAYFLNNFLPHGKINFAMNNFKKNDWMEVKTNLKAMGRSARYVEIKNSASILFNNLVDKGAELTLFEYQIFITQAIQSFTDFSERDYGRPGRDDKSGMLPPKLAIMMLNLADITKESTLFDPFCGSGTIITEAVLLGIKNILGADISEKAIKDTKNNIEWTMLRYSIPQNNHSIEILRSDARHLSAKIKSESIDAIVTEPFLGKPLKGRETFEEIKMQSLELKKLYIMAFEQFQKILTANGCIIFIIPCFRYKGDWIRIDCLSEIKKLGFTPVSMWKNENHLLYSRPDQHVGREIWKFKHSVTS